MNIHLNAAFAKMQRPERRCGTRRNLPTVLGAFLVLLAISVNAQAGQWKFKHYVLTGDRDSAEVRWGKDLWNNGLFKYQVRPPAGYRTIVRHQPMMGIFPGAMSAAARSQMGFEPLPWPTPFAYYPPPSIRSSTDSNVRAVFEWERNTIMGSGLKDPNDNPPKFLFVRETAIIFGWKRIYNGDGWPISPPYTEQTPWAGDYYKLEAEFKVKDKNNEWSGGLGEGIPTWVGQGAWNYSKIHKRINQIAVGNNNTVSLPAVNFKGQITLGPGYENDRGAYTDAHIEMRYSAEPINLSFTPDPNGLALDDCIDQPGPKIFNQYLITEGIPCKIKYRENDAEILERLRQESEWTLTNPPLSLWPRLANRKNAYGDILPVEYVSDWAGGYETDGLSFDLRNGLPADNLGFGIRTITHSFWVRVDAKVALFYPSTGTEHPAGGPWGWSNQIRSYGMATPNWIYYYSKLVDSPCRVEYMPIPAGTNWSGAYYPGEPNVWLCNAHGYWQTAIFRRVGSGSNPPLQFVGKEETKGIDTYARVLRHELTHKRCYEYIHRPGANPLVEDSDEDGVPDAWESSVGLSFDPTNPKRQDSTGFAAAWGGYPLEQGDSEVFARLCEEDVWGSMGSDWADTGLQRVGSPPNVCKRTVVTDKSGNTVASLSALPGTKVSNLP